MIKRLLQRLLYSLSGRKHRGYHRYSSSDYSKQHYPPQHRQRHYGHGYYKKRKYSSFSS